MGMPCNPKNQQSVLVAIEGADWGLLVVQVMTRVTVRVGIVLGLGSGLG